jgi:predicted nucleotidyltransferase component of viral defense system
MEKLKTLIKQWRMNFPRRTEQVLFGQAREYLQVIALKTIYQSKFGSCLSFMGGTCLRICYDLKRYSEDLDFSLDDRTSSYSFLVLIEVLKREFELMGFKILTTVSKDKTVQKAFLRFSDLSEQLELKSLIKGQKLHIKIEVDTNPPPLQGKERESFFVNRFDEIFPILKHDLPTLFAGKILAILYRPYTRGRDYYDLIWYLSQKVEPNIDYLNRGVKGKKFKGRRDVFTAVEKQIKKITPADILKDVGQFLEDPAEQKWILEYEFRF